MLRNFLPYMFFFNCKLHKPWQLFFKSPFIKSALSFIWFYSKSKNGAHVTRGRGDNGAEVTGVEVSGAEVVGAEVTRGRSD